MLHEKGPGPRQPALRPRPPDQPHLRPGLDQIRPDGPQPRGGHRLLDRRSLDRRRGADDQGRRRRHHARRRRRERPSARSASPASPRRGRSAPDFNDQPEKASRPYDKDRDGFVMGEGAGVVVLEEYEHAKARGAKIYAEVDRLWPVGRRLSRDRAASRRLAAPTARWRWRCKKSGLQPSDIDYINAHGTSTPLGDELELGAVRRAVRQRDRRAVDELDQVGDRPSARRRRRGREHLLHPRHARPDRPADAQPRQSERGDARASTSSRTRPRSGRSAPC